MLIFSICNDKEFNQYIPLPYPYHKSDAKKWIKLQSQKRESGLGFDFAVVLKADNKLIGSVSIEIDKKINLESWAVGSQNNVGEMVSQQNL